MTIKMFGHTDGDPAQSASGRWIDLKSPDQREIDEARESTRLRIPTRAELEEIETSSRTYMENGSLFMSLPMLFKATAEAAQATPVGFILTQNALVTVRFDDLQSFDRVQGSLSEVGSSTSVFVRLLETIIDRLADVSEHAEDALQLVSKRIFGREDAIESKPNRATANLRAVLRRIGRLGNLLSLIRGCLLGLQRMIPFVANHAAQWLTPECVERLAIAKSDVASLTEFETYLSDKLQFALDATLGFINITQNDLFRVLTIASVIGIPPTILVGVWGMNFKHMPELDWSYGYALALLTIVISGVLPAAWFKVRGWL